MLNCIDMDGQGQGYDTPLITAVQDACGIPIVASSGAGAVSHFSTVSNLLNILLLIVIKYDFLITYMLFAF